MRAEAQNPPSGISELFVFAWGTTGVMALLGWLLAAFLYKRYARYVPVWV